MAKTSSDFIDNTVRWGILLLKLIPLIRSFSYVLNIDPSFQIGRLPDSPFFKVTFGGKKFFPPLLPKLALPSTENLFYILALLLFIKL